MFLVDKPLGWTSFQVIKKLRQELKVKKLGHAGTLDPLATGLLIICTGKETKKIADYQGLDKVYTGDIVLGRTTPSFDRETAIDQEHSWQHISQEDILAAAAKQVGEISQRPPIYSAIKKQGKRAYLSAREGDKIILAPRLVEVKQFTITKVALPTVSFKIHCSKGVYIRAMARDLGEELGVGGYLHRLRRTDIGPYSVSNAADFDSFFPLNEAKIKDPAIAESEK